MIKPIFFGLKSPIKWAIVLPGVLSLYLFPSKTGKVIFKSFNKGVSIQSAKTEPPRIAFYEMKASIQNKTNQEIRASSSVDLNDGLAAPPQGSTLSKVKYRQVALEPLHISRQQIIDEKPDLSWVDSLPKNQKQRILAAQEKEQVLDQDWKLPTWRDQLQEQLAEANAKATSFHRQEKVLVKSGEQTPETLHGQAGIVMNDPPPADEKKSLFSGLAVKGHVEVKEGLGVVPGDYIDIRYLKEKIPVAAGKINLPSNQYQIQIPEQSGQIVATLFSRDGTKMGEGSLRLSPNLKLEGDATTIKIAPVQTQVALSNRDFDKLLAAGRKQRDYGDKGLPGKSYFASVDTEVATDESGIARLENVTKDSFLLVRSESPGYYPALNLIHAGGEVQKPAFRKKFIDALISISRDAQVASSIQENNSVIWGQAKFDGKPQAGIKVEVEMTEDYQIVYFNSWMIPDSSLMATSENGYYAILHLPEGFYSLLATRGNQYFSHANVQAEPESVFLADLESSLKTEKVELKAFDAFSGDPQRVQVELQSLSEPVMVEGFADLYLPQVNRLGLIRSVPADQNYLITTNLYSDTDESISLPLIRASWLQAVQQQQKISLEPHRAIIVGFVLGEPFEVFLSHNPDFPRGNIIYFDHEGRISEAGVPGGGFIIFNVEPGTQSVVTLSKTSNLAFSQVIPVEPDAVAVLRYDY